MMSKKRGNMSIESEAPEIVFATDHDVLADGREYHITIAHWCVDCFLQNGHRCRAMFIYRGRSLCHECLEDARMGDES
jgi:hypothetical protein